MHYIKDIFEKKNTQHAHDKFVRYSKGEFVGPLVNIRVQSAGVKVAASFHFVDELLQLAINVLGNDKVHVKGSLVWNQDLTQKFEDLGIKHSKVTKSRGIFKYVLDNDVHFEDFVKSMGSYNLLLTIKNDKISFVTKSTPPKPNKEFGPDFCKVTFPKDMLDVILKEFAFDISETKVKDIKIGHEISLVDIELPKDAANFEEARKLAIRKGNLKRSIEVDGDTRLSQIDFEI